MNSKELSVDDHVKLLLDGEAHTEPCEISSDEEFKLPPWFEEEKYKRGQNYIKDNLFAQFTCSLSGLVCVLAVPSILNILVKTQKSSTTDSAFKRYLSTVYHVYSWFMEELKPGTDAWKSLFVVRTRHFKASKGSRLKGDHYITQRDMVLTQFVFLAAGLLEPEKIGMSCDNQDDIEGYTHFWRTIGYMLGISDKYNLCRPSLSETKKVFEVVRREVFCYHLLYPPEYFYHMATAVLRGMWYFNPFLMEGAFLYYSMWIYNVKGYDYDKKRNKYSIKLLTDPKAIENEDSLIRSSNNNLIKNERLEVQVLEKTLGPYNRFGLHLLHFVSNATKSYIGKLYWNNHTRLSIFLLKHFPFLSFWHFGLRGAFVNMFADDVPVHTELKTNKEMFSLMKT